MIFVEYNEYTSFTSVAKLKGSCLSDYECGVYANCENKICECQTRFAKMTNNCKKSQISLYTNIYKYIQIYTNIYKYIQIYTNIYKYIQIYTNIYKYIQIYTNIYKYIYIYIYIYILNYIIDLYITQIYY